MYCAVSWKYICAYVINEFVSCIPVVNKELDSLYTNRAGCCMIKLHTNTRLYETYPVPAATAYVFVAQ
jgi:hypothetical protein